MASTDTAGVGGYDYDTQQLWDYARYLGMDPEVDSDLMWIAEESMRAPMPPGWVVLEAPDGTPYYYHEATQESRWNHPAEDHYRHLYSQNKGSMPLPATPTTQGGKQILLPPAHALLEESDSSEPSTPKHQVGWVGAGGESSMSPPPAPEDPRRLENEVACLRKKSKKLQDRDNNSRRTEDADDRQTPPPPPPLPPTSQQQQQQEDVERLQSMVRKLRLDREGLERALRRAEHDLDKEVSFTRKLRKENDFLKRNLEEMEVELLAHTWDTTLAEVEENLRSTFTKEGGDGEGGIKAKEEDEGQQEEWMVNVEMLQTMTDDLQAILNSFSPYLEDGSPTSTGTSTGTPPRQERRSKLPSAGSGGGNKEGEEASSKMVDQLNGQLREAQSKCAEAENKVRLLEVKLEEVRASKEVAVRMCDSLRDQVCEAKEVTLKQTDGLRARFEEQEEQLRSRVRTLEEQEGQYKSHISSLEPDLERTQRQLKAAEEQVSTLEAQVSKYKKRAASLDQERQKLEEGAKNATEQADRVVAQLREEIEQLIISATKSSAMVDQLNEDVKEHKAKAEEVVARCEAQLKAKDEECKSTLEGMRAKNRQLNERILELQGNIRVLCRIRPMSKKELDTNTGGPAIEQLIQYPDEGLLLFHDQKYEYDQVFRPDSEQSNIFKDVQPAIWSAVNGYRVCIFAYGQTGSGKTFTMEGPPEDRGVNYRAINEVFTLARAQAHTMDYTIRMSMLEVYNETVQDLLGDPNAKTKSGLDIRVGQNKQVYVEGLTQCEVEGMSDVESLMGLGSRNRHTGSTNMNEHSSRSHLVLSLTIIGTNKKTGVRSGGKLSLIDLAGSERLKSTGATGDRLEEAKNINKSLSALGDVIASLANSNGHVPYRNSKLTFLLQDSLGPSSKVIMFVNINPAPPSAQESICSLNFAARCRSVQLGQAKKARPTAVLARSNSSDETKDDRK